MRWSTGFMGGLAAAFFLTTGWAQQTPEARQAALQKIVDDLHFQTGEVKLGSDLATLKLPVNLRYLDPKDARTVLVDLWGNPPDQGDTLGMIVPAEGFLGDNSWAVVVTYEEDGHVSDADADKINYDDLLKEMKQSTKEASAERQKEGYGSVELIGWAATPKYDREGKKLYWAKEIEFDGRPEHTLNYNIRILGRKGVLVLNAIAGNQDLPVIEAATPGLLSAISFNPGSRYADFDKSTDKLATYGIAALVAGGVAAKMGFFKLFWVGILAFKKFIIIGAIAAAGFVKRFFGRKTA